ncbi:hypothetical protein DYQ86_20045 [Acidobacteria bacterium AB60]|nr:hypothetical protein DYQ86_20045 [Acidobacteria bacterium AB60]
MQVNETKRPFRHVWLTALALSLAGLNAAAAPVCTRVVLTGEVNAGRTWQASLGEGWVFRILPIPPGQARYSGWDLTLDRDPPAGYPDALLLATPPYNSINEREIGTTFGLRAQDAIGWNPRSFHFMTDPAAFNEAQPLFRGLLDDRQLTPSSGNGSREMTRLLSLEQKTASGELHIDDARLTPGIGDPAPFAQAWALAAARTQHEIVPGSGGNPSASGSLAWMRFTVTLWLPRYWKVPATIRGTQAPCQE